MSSLVNINYVTNSSGVLEGSDNYDNLKSILSDINALILSNAKLSATNLKYLGGGNNLTLFNFLNVH